MPPTAESSETEFGFLVVILSFSTLTWSPISVITRADRRRRWTEQGYQTVEGANQVSFDRILVKGVIGFAGGEKSSKHK
jgi:hypothetical protein